MDHGNTGKLREGPVVEGSFRPGESRKATCHIGTGNQVDQTPVMPQRTQMVQQSAPMTNTAPQQGMQGIGGQDMSGYSGATSDPTSDGKIDPRMGPGPAVGSAGGFRDSAQAAMTAKPVVGPGFGPGAVNATPAVRGDYNPLDNDERIKNLPTAK